MRGIAVLVLLVLAGCTDPLAILTNRWTMDVAATPCWAAFSVSFSLDGNGIGEWGSGGRAVADGPTPTEVRFFPASGGRGADYARGTFTDPHAILTGGGTCVADATIARG